MLNIEEVFIDSLKRNNIFFFAGSGISISSRVPSVFQILDKTASIFLSDYDTDSYLRNVVMQGQSVNNAPSFGIQPELFYEALISVWCGDIDCLKVWSALNSNAQQKFGVKYTPNLVHCFVVTYSYHSKQPVITTNYDTMFEQACTLLNIPYIIYLPGDKLEGSIDSDELKIVKIHGSIENAEGIYTPENLKATMTEITRKNSYWIDEFLIPKLRDNSRICFIGYSGKDIDIFPYIGSIISKTSNAFWINRYINSDATSVLTKKNADRVMAMFINYYPSEILPRINNELNFVEESLIEEPKGQIPDAFYDEIEAELRAKVGNAIFNERKLLLKILLYSIKGDSQNTLQLTKQIKNFSISLHFEKMLKQIETRAKREIADNLGYRKSAKKMLPLYRENKSDFSYYILAKLEVLSSYQMDIPPFIYINYRLFDKICQALASLRYLLHLIFISFAFMLKGISHPSFKREPLLLDFRLRTLAFFNRLSFLKRFPFFNKIIVEKYESLDRIGRQIGHHGIVTEVRKYLSRTDNLEENDFEYGLVFAELKNDYSTLCILNRDRAHLMAQDKNNHNFRDVFDYAKLALEYAKMTSNVLNIVKCGFLIIHVKQSFGEAIIAEDINLLDNYIDKITGFWMPKILKRAVSYIR
jgi:hypothetical protein